MKIKEVADRIHAHLMRLEVENCPADGELPRFYHACAYRAGRFVGVIYVSYQGSYNLPLGLAVEYLEALDAGYDGKHFNLDRWKGKR